jgi:hypothetical protein
MLLDVNVVFGAYLVLKFFYYTSRQLSGYWPLHGVIIVVLIERIDKNDQILDVLRITLQHNMRVILWTLFAWISIWIFGLLTNRFFMADNKPFY